MEMGESYVEVFVCELCEELGVELCGFGFLLLIVIEFWLVCELDVELFCMDLLYFVCEVEVG